MSNWNAKLDNIEETKALIKDAIVEKGVPVTTQDSFRSYATKISDIKAGGGDGLIGVTTISKEEFVDGRTHFSDIITGYIWSEYNKLHVKNLSSFFAFTPGQINLTGFKTEGCINMTRMFDNCKQLKSLDLTAFDTSKVTSFDYMFNECNSLKEIKGITNLNTDSLKSAVYVFNNATALTSLDLSGWTTPVIENVNNLFHYADNCLHVDISNMNTDHVTNCSGMFTPYGGRMLTVKWPNNWMPNPAIMEFSLTGVPKLEHETVLDLFNKLSTRTNNPTLSMKAETYDRMTADEIAIATGKGWNVTKA